MSKMPLLQLKKVVKSYPQGNHQFLKVLKGCDLTLHEGEVVGLVGVSGSGKSSLLHIAGLLDHPTDGEVFLEGQSAQSQKDSVLTQWRNKKIGFIYQFHHLLPELTALENVMIPLLMGSTSWEEAQKISSRYLKDLGLSDRCHHLPSQLSGGEQQRVAVARAFANNPRVILADEPTGNLDFETAHLVFSLFLKVARERGVSCLIATHDRTLASQMDRIVEIRDGCVVKGHE